MYVHDISYFFSLFIVLLIKGIVTAAIASINPLNQDEVVSAPGFNTIDNEGDSAQLISYGDTYISNHGLDCLYIL